MLKLLLAATAGCALSRHPETLAPIPASAASDWASVLAKPGPVTVESAASARWMAKLEGLVNLDDPKAQAAGLGRGEVPIVLPVHVLRHPTRGVFIIDTGVDREMAAGERGPVRGLVRAALKGMDPVEPLGEILARQPAPLAGVFITHMHPDHVLGLGDVPPEVPVYIGPGEQQVRSLMHLFLRRSYKQLTRDRAPFQVWDFEAAPTVGDFKAVDVLGDGSIWALHTPGHTPGSTSYLANTPDGPVLFVGDTSHTLWGWENLVEPGSYTADHPTNLESLKELKALSAQLPEMPVWTGHELGGEGTGADEYPGFKGAASP